MADTNTYQAQANELSQKLWAIANELRQMDASESSRIIFLELFLSLSVRTRRNVTAEIMKMTGDIRRSICG